MDKHNSTWTGHRKKIIGSIYDYFKDKLYSQQFS